MLGCVFQGALASDELGPPGLVEDVVAIEVVSGIVFLPVASDQGQGHREDRGVSVKLSMQMVFYKFGGFVDLLRLFIQIIEF